MVSKTRQGLWMQSYLDKLGSLRQPELDGVGLPLEVEEADEGETRGQEREGDRQHRVPRHETTVPE